MPTKQPFGQPGYAGEVMSREEVERIARQLGLKPKDQPRPRIGYEYGGRPIYRNPDGSFMTEESVTVQHPGLNQGRWTNFPSVWGGRSYPADQAAELAVRSDTQFPGFDTLEEADKEAIARSAKLGEELDAGRYWEGEIPQPVRKPDLLGGQPRRRSRDLLGGR
jgi:hypothetical protein